MAYLESGAMTVVLFLLMLLVLYEYVRGIESMDDGHDSSH